jgi:exonuclease III
MNNITTKFNGNQGIKIVQWNCRSLRSKFPEFQQRSQNIDIIILSETWLDEAENVYLTGFDVVRKDRNERSGGVAIFINNKLKYSRKEGLYDGDGKIEVCAIELYTGQEKY